MYDGLLPDGYFAIGDLRCPWWVVEMFGTTIPLVYYLGTFEKEREGKKMQEEVGLLVGHIFMIGMLLQVGKYWSK